MTVMTKLIKIERDVAVIRNLVTILFGALCGYVIVGLFQ